MVKMTSVEAQNRFGKLLDTAQQEVVEITRHGRSVAFLISPREMANVLELQRRRRQAVAEFATWRKSAQKTRKPAAGALTDDEISRMVHELR